MRLALLLFAVLLAGQPARWRLISKTSLAYTYTDRDREEREGETVRRWERIVPRADTDAGREIRARTVAFLTKTDAGRRAARYSYTLMRREYNCAGGETRVLQQIFYDSTGRSLYTTKRVEEWKSPPPESGLETAMQDACTHPVEMQ